MKYNITEKKEKDYKLSYRSAVTPEFVEKVAQKIILKLMIEQKYRDPKYSAKRLAGDIDVNTRHISAVVNLRFQMNYSGLVSQMRIYEAKYMLQDRNFDNMTVEDIATNVGFSTRQSFYATFYRLCGITPKEYRLAHGFVPKAETPPATKPKKKKGGKATPKKKVKRTKGKITLKGE